MIGAIVLLSASEGYTQNDAASPPQQSQQQKGASAPLPSVQEQVPDTDYYKVSCERPKDHDAADLCEQRRMAKAAEDAVWWARVQTFLGIFGFITVLVSLIFTGWAAIAASRAAKASLAGANAAQQAADVAEESFRRLERPYLFVRFDNMSTHMLRVKYVPHGIPYLTFKLVNSGKMPAILRSVAVELESDLDFSLRIPKHANRDLYEVLEQGDESTIFPNLYVKGGKVGEPWVGDRFVKLVFRGRYIYEDPTGAVHIDRFCMRGTKDGKFVIEGGSEHNWRKTEYPKKPNPEAHS